MTRDLRADVVQESAIQAGVERIERRLRFYSPEVECSGSDPGLFWVDAAGLELAYPSLEQWAEMIQIDLSEMGFEAHVAVGRSRFGTYAAAKSGAKSPKAGATGSPATSGAAGSRTARSGATGSPARSEARRAPAPMIFQSIQEEREFIRAIQIDRFTFDPDSREVLRKLEVTTLGAFIDLPPESVQRRFPPGICRLHRLARGELWDPLQPLGPTRSWKASRILDDPEPDRGRLCAHAHDLLHELLVELASAQQALAEIDLLLVMEHDGTGSRGDDGARKPPPRRRETFRPAEPTLDEEQLRELIAIRLDSLTLPAGVMELELRAASVPFASEQLQLLTQTPKRDRAPLNRAFARLRAEFGDEAVVHARIEEGHLPEARFAWSTLAAMPIPNPRRVATRPLVRRILDRPRPLPPRPRHEPDGWLITGVEGGSVEEILGPYIVSGGWWRRDVHREYHFAKTVQGRWLWVYFDRERRRWFHQGEVE
jgi:protein ImuB